MHNNLVLLEFNNYFNRKVLKHEDLTDYINGHKYSIIPGVNFIPGDGVSTDQIVNFNEGWTPDYVLVLNEYNAIVSRWFILSASRTRVGQYSLKLRRDLIADYLDDVKAAPCFIEKANIRDVNSPFIYNNEGIAVNQIKTQEILLKDRSNSAWIVGYLSRQPSEDETMPTSWTVKGSSASHTEPAIEYDTLPIELRRQIEAKSYVFIDSEAKWELTIQLANDSKSSYTININDKPRASYKGKAWLDSSYLLPRMDSHDVVCDDLESQFDINEFYNVLNGAYHIARTERDVYSGYGNKLIKRGDRYYRLRYTPFEQLYRIDRRLVRPNESSDALSDFFNHYVSKLIGAKNWSLLDPQDNRPYAQLSGSATIYRLDLEDDFTHDVKVTIDNGARTHLVDAPYDIFCMPLNEVSVAGISPAGSALPLTLPESDVAISIARSLKLTLGSWCYDIQILPYCPMQEILTNKGVLSVTQLVEHADYELVKDSASNDVVSVMLFPMKSKGSFNITIDNPPEELISQKTVLGKKIYNETRKVRLCSPNYNGEFEFSPQKNDGATIYNVDYNLKPYSPYIHVAPLFKGLYGGEFNDARGLICGGDFSIAMVDSAWTQYQINNKNYENIFNREIQNMDFNNKLDMGEQITNMLVGTAQGAATGGFAFGGLGAGAGAALSLAGGIADTAMLGVRQGEAKSFKTDMYNYNLQNVKALPYSLSKVGAYNENNKIWPFMEIYACTESEEKAFANKLEYDGMTVMVLDRIANWVGDEPALLRGQLVRLDTIDSTALEAEAIYGEISKGVYI